MDDDKYNIPKYLDAPMKIFLLGIDEIILLIGVIFLGGYVFDQVVLSIMTGGGLVYWIKKIKGEQGHYFLLNWTYWYLPPVVLFKLTPPSYQREIIG